MERLPYTHTNVIESAINNIKQNYTGKYNPETFWEEYGKIYSRTFSIPDDKGEYAKDVESGSKLTINIPTLVSRVHNLQPESVLEVGCGFGRCMPFVLENNPQIKRFVGIEFSSTMIEQSKTYLNEYSKKDQITIIRGDARELPFKDNEFDLVYTHVCLTHIPPEFIPKVQSEISRVAKNNIIHIERHAYDYEHPNPHRWSHTLPPFYLANGWKILEYDLMSENVGHYTKVLCLER